MYGQQRNPWDDRLEMMSESEFERLFPLSWKERNPETGNLEIRTYRPIDK